MDRLKLVEYLNTIVTLEKEHYEQKQIIERLKMKYNEANKPRFIPMKQCGSPPSILNYVEPPETEGFANLIFFAGLILGGLGFGVGLLFRSSWIRGHSLILFLICSIPYIICQVKEIIEFVKDRKEYKGYCDNISIENEKIKERNSLIQTQSKVRCNQYLMEYKNVDKSYWETKRLLQDYYDLGVLYPKYRDFACVTAILEYFLSGRCTTLTGHEGAYNLLEQELRLNAILTKLDIVINNLEEIKQNQNLLYNAIKECNSAIDSMSRRIDNQINLISYNQKSIITNQEVMEGHLASIDYTSQINQNNIRFLKNLAIYERILK